MRGTHTRGPLVRLSWDTILATITSNGSTNRSLSGEIVERIGEVFQSGQLTDGGRNRTGETVVGNIQLLQALHLANGGWQ